jgi:hypothetical protein
MRCPHCATENPTPFGYCSGCQKPLSVVEGVAPPPPPAQPKTMSLWSWLGLAAVVALAVTAAFVRPVEEGTPAFQTGYRIGGLLASLGIPALIAYVIAGRKKARKPNLFALIFGVVCILFLAANFAGEMNFESADQRISRLMREAAGLQRIRQAMFPRDRRWDDGVRDVFRDLLRQNKDYMEAYSKIDQSQVGKINQPESFVDARLAAPALKQLHAAYDLEAAQEIRVKEILGKLRTAMESGVSSASEREAVEKGFEQGMAKQMPKRRRVVEAEKQWVDAVDSEYAYAQQHEKDFQLIQGHLGIPVAAVREEFNARVRQQEARRKELLEAKKEFDQFQSQTLQKVGMSAKDAGMQ